MHRGRGTRIRLGSRKLAVLRDFAVIGEAVRGLPADAKAAHSDTPWPAIAGLRNVVVHEYFRVEPEIVIDILDKQLESLMRSIRSSLDE
ncbi:HepT-like ribonuclease domain-containing protein [Agromyces sp. NPDC055520]